MDAEKAECYRASGENTAAFLLTMTGIDGVYQGAANGIKAFNKVTPVVDEAAQISGQLPGLATRAKNAVMAEMPAGHDMSASTAIRFVLGLLDEALLLFNYLAEKMKKSGHLHQIKLSRLNGDKRAIKAGRRKTFFVQDMFWRAQIDHFPRQNFIFRAFA